MIFPRFSPFIPVLALTLALSARAGVLLVSHNQSLTEKKDPLIYNVSIDKDRVRIEGVGDARSFIYRGDKQLFWIVDNKEKNYMEMTKQDLEAISLKMDSAMVKMQESMKNMPPQQREMMEKMMKSMMPGAGARAKTTYKKVAVGEKVGNWSCDKYEGMAEGTKKVEMWITDPKQLGLGESDYQAIKDMARFFEKLIKNAENNFGFGIDKDGPQGLPVKTLSFRDGKASFKTEVKEFKKKDFGEGWFEVPAGLTKKQMGPGAGPK
jgi:hypothetical protein